MSRQTQAIIHADAIVNNYLALSSLAPNCESMAVIKANAYGHGAVSVARILRDHASHFVVAIIEEAITLREAGITSPVVVLEGAHQPKECALAYRNHCILVAHSEYQLQWLLACPKDQRPVVWIKVDTGMHRLGFSVQDLPTILSKYKSLITPESVLVTHFSSADDLDSDATFSQLRAFNHIVDTSGMAVSIANSPASILWPNCRQGWIRLGVGLYGSQPEGGKIDLKPAMTLRSSVIALRDIAPGESVGYGHIWTATTHSRIATIGIGYADGYPRHCANGTPVLVNGQRAQLVGRVSMDMITVDVTGLEQVAIGDKVELWGEHLSIDEVAQHANTISYELMTCVSARVPRIVKHR